MIVQVINDRRRIIISVGVACAALLSCRAASAQELIGEEPALGSAESRITQAEIASGALSLHDIRMAGLRVFATQLRRADGYGDGRPMLQNNGTFLRVNGLDAQACQDCHSIVSADAMPTVLGIGGAGGINDSAMFMTRAIDVADISGNGFAAFDGRLINPPALFGVGAVQLVASEMTAILLRKRSRAIKRPGQVVRLVARGVDFGTIVADASGNVDTSNVQGIDADLIVRPFGRKGEFPSIRQFDLGAMVFHLGMQPVEAVGTDIDADADGVTNEVKVGEISALDIFLASQDRPVRLAMSREARKGSKRFRQIGCSSCHVPRITTSSSVLHFAFPEVDGDSAANAYYHVDLAAAPTHFEQTRKGGIVVRMFSDLKRHDMGDALAEAFHGATGERNSEFVTAKLWGVADTAPYLHDGRAMTLAEAIRLHGGEASASRDGFESLDVARQNEILAFLKTLRNPASPNADVTTHP